MSDPSSPGKSPHAFMREALDVQARLRDQRLAFVAAACAAEAEALACGAGFTADEVEAYFAARAAEQPAERPSPRPWRK